MPFKINKSNFLDGGYIYSNSGRLEKAVSFKQLIKGKLITGFRSDLTMSLLITHIAS